jgi:hypothetical protein
MERISRDPKDAPRKDGKDARRDGTPGADTQRSEYELDEDLKDTFPASDPVPPKHVD